MCFAAGTAAAQHDMSHMPGMGAVALPLGIPLSRLGSGTSWLPDSSPMHAAHWTPGDAGWTLMGHGSAFGELDRQTGFRGDTQTGLVDWEMLMALRSAAGGVLRLDAMTSLEALVLGPRGYPELAQTGGTYQGGQLVNRQHPHELLMELGGAYDHALTSTLAASLYAAAVGEPVLGPVAYMHRPSAADDPFAPLGHHWQDASHESFGVVTAGLYSRAVKLEGSAFNGRDPDAHYLSPDFSGARLDSYAGRLTVTPNPYVALSGWGGYVYGHDPLERDIGMQRYGASILTQTPGFGDRWSSAVVWGLNIHHHGSREHVHDSTEAAKMYHVSSSLLVESTFDVTSRVSLSGRAEQVQKSVDDLGFLGGDPMQLFNIRALSLGMTREIGRRGDASIAVGACGTLNLLPETLRLTYQGRTPLGLAVFLRLRPAKMHETGGE